MGCLLSSCACERVGLVDVGPSSLPSGIRGGKMIWMEMAAPSEGCLAKESHRRGFEF